MPNETDDEKAGNGSGEPKPEAAGEPAPQTIEDMITQLETEKTKFEQAAKENYDRLLRTTADFENFKKRAKKEIDEGAQRGREAILKEILPVVDNLERALKHAANDDPLAAGVRMVEKQFLQALEKFGITRFTAQGQPFDPALHDAIQQIETREHAPGTVAQDFASGYMSNGKLFRAAMVGVAKAPDEGKKG
jgi:molecular chaperone GrpE